MSAKITKALHDVMSNVGYVQKLGKNDFHNYTYASEVDLLKKLRPAMLEAGLMLIPSITEVSSVDEHGNTNIRMAYTLAHKDGDIWPHLIMAAGCGNDRNRNGVGDKGLYKAITGANKYLLFKLFQIETGEDAEDDTKQQQELAEMQATYIKIALMAIKAQETAADLDVWWKGQAANRKEVGIVKGNIVKGVDLYDMLVSAAKVQKSVIQEKANG